MAPPAPDEETIAEAARIISRLQNSDEPASMKLGAFKLQSQLADLLFAHAFVAAHGLRALKAVLLSSTGNTLAYALASLERLLEYEVDESLDEDDWAMLVVPVREAIGGETIERLVEIVAEEASGGVNVVRAALGILVQIVAGPSSTTIRHGNHILPGSPLMGGSRALKLAQALHPGFMPALVTKMDSADHALCATGLQLLNSLLRDCLLQDVSSTSPTATGGGIAAPNDSSNAANAGIGAGERRHMRLGSDAAAAEALKDGAKQAEDAETPDEDRVSMPIPDARDAEKLVVQFVELRVFDAVWKLMRSTGLADVATPVLEFQGLVKVLIERWRTRPAPSAAIYPETISQILSIMSKVDTGAKDDLTIAPVDELSLTPEQKLGFPTADPTASFSATGLLGLVDLNQYVQHDPDAFRRTLMEQAALPVPQRCPLARVSLAATSILYDHFECDDTSQEGAIVAGRGILPAPDSDNPSRLSATLAASLTTPTAHLDRLVRPLILQWSRLHRAAVDAFMRLWTATGAEMRDFPKVEDLVRILVEQVVGQAPRNAPLEELERNMQDVPVDRLRELQMELLELTYEDAWGDHLRHIRNELHNEALQFVREQRIRCLLDGCWFSSVSAYRAHGSGSGVDMLNKHLLGGPTTDWRFVRLSHNRRYLHYGHFDLPTNTPPSLDLLPDKIDLNTVSSVVSNVSATTAASSVNTSTDDLLKSPPLTPTPNLPLSGSNVPQTKITIYGYPDSIRNTDSPAIDDSSRASSAQQKERVLLTLFPATHSVASEWLDGLLMLLQQQPITADTNKLIKSVASLGMKVKLVNVRWGDVVRSLEGKGEGELDVPGREGVDDEFWYEIPGS